MLWQYPLVPLWEILWLHGAVGRVPYSHRGGGAQVQALLRQLTSGGLVCQIFLWLGYALQTTIFGLLNKAHLMQIAPLPQTLCDRGKFFITRLRDINRHALSMRDSEIEHRQSIRGAYPPQLLRYHHSLKPKALLSLATAQKSSSSFPLCRFIGFSRR